MDFSQIILEAPQIRTARLENGKWVILDSLSAEARTEQKHRHYKRLCRRLNNSISRHPDLYRKS